MSEDGCSRLDAGRCLDALRHRCAVADTLGVDDDIVLLASLTRLDDTIDDRLLIAIVTLRKKDLLRTVCDTAPEGDVTGTTAHNLDDRATLVRGRGITQLIDRLHRGIDGGIEADRIIGTCDIEIDGTRHTDGVDAECTQLAGATEGTVTTDDNDSVDTMLTADLRTTGLALRCGKLLASCSVEDSTTTADGIRYRGRIHVDDLLLQKTRISSHDTLYLDALVNRRTNHATDTGVHARCITTRCQYTNRLHSFRRHNPILQIY